MTFFFINYFNLCTKKYFQTNIHFKGSILWCPGHVGISGNEITDKLAVEISSFLYTPFLKILCSDILPYLGES